MTNTLELAISKAAALPEAAQEQIGRELLERIDVLSELRAQIEVGLRELDSGKGSEIEVDQIITRARKEHAKKVG